MCAVFYRKALRAPVRAPRSVRISDFSRGINKGKDENILPLSHAALTYNFSVKDGALRDGAGFSRFTFNGAGAYGIEGESPARVWQYRRYDFNRARRDDRLIVYTESGKLYSAPLTYDGGFRAIEGAEFRRAPSAVNYRLNGDDVIIFCSDSENMTVWDGENYPYTVTDSPRITSMDVHYERLFATVDGDRRQVWFSDDLDPTNWKLDSDAAGFIEMADERGALLKAVSFLDYLYVFREYGISRVFASGGQDEFAVGQLFVSSGCIRADTVALCGDAILFMADDGLYMFNGLSARRILGNMTPMFGTIGNAGASAVFCNGKYYLACRMDYGDGLKIGCERGEYVNNTLIELDIGTMCCCLTRGADARSLEAVKCGGESAVAACLKTSDGGAVMRVDYSGAADGEILPKLWATPSTDFGTDKTKVLKYVSLHTDTAVELEVRADGVTKTFPAGGGRRTVVRVPVNMKGKSVGVSFKCAEAGARISSPILFFDLVD